MIKDLQAQCSSSDSIIYSAESSAKCVFTGLPFSCSWQALNTLQLLRSIDVFQHVAQLACLKATFH
jgi:hypothetical protein